MVCKRPLLFKGNKAKIKEEDEVKLEPGEAQRELGARLVTSAVKPGRSSQAGTT